MGLTLAHFASGFKRAVYPDLIPGPFEEPTFDPLYGFPLGRPQRVMEASEEAMRSAKLPLEDRDYCAHKLLAFRKCRVDKWPFPVLCKHENHAYLKCRYDDFVLRMMEYEREKRLRVRQKNIEERDSKIICEEDEPEKGVAEEESSSEDSL